MPDRRFAVQQFPAEVVILDDYRGQHETFASAWEKAKRQAGWPACRLEIWWEHRVPPEVLECLL